VSLFFFPLHDPANFKSFQRAFYESLQADS